MLMFKREKWTRLTIGAGFDRHTIPIFDASYGGNRTVPLLKTLMSSFCQNDCKFCAFRCERKIRRDRWKPEELAKIGYKLWKMKKIKGVFLSSSVERDPDYTVERQIQTIELLRKMGFTEYVHLRIMPGTSRELIKRAVEISDRVGINVELPNSGHYEDMKLFLRFKQDIIRRLRWAAREIEKVQKQGKCKAGLDSQMIVGVSDETDREILQTSELLYKRFNVRRVYYSRFEPISNTPLEHKQPENPWREYRLYQASFLLRDYGFGSKDFVFDDKDKLKLSEDPKFSIAKESNLLVDVNEASFDELVRVPGIGLNAARKIVENRPVKNTKELRCFGVVLKRAIPFIEISKYRQSRLSRWLN